jgi:hypothetical protein
MAMRPTTPNFNFAQQAGPSSPPETPTTASFHFNLKNRRHGIQNFSHPLSTSANGAIKPNGNGPTFSYNPTHDLELSPRSSSPASSSHSVSSTSTAPRSRSPSPSTHNPPPPQTRTRIIAEGNFTLEEFAAEDYLAFNSSTESIIRPSQYEDAPSSRAHSPPHRELDPNILHGLQNLNCDLPTDEELDERELWLLKVKEEKRRKRRSSSSVQKRTIEQSIGSGTDDEDIQPVLFEGANEAGSSARRLRRKVGDRASLIFDDPPARIDELEEPVSCEEVVSVGDEDEDEVGDLRELPYFVYVQEMEIDEDDD